jgi:hypothetical protein
VIFGGLQFLARELLARAEEELYDEDKVHHEMTEAYAALESGAISEEEFDRREQELMDRLETIEARRQRAAGGADEGDEDEDDEDALEEEEEDDDDDDALEEDEDEGEGGSEVHYGVFDAEDKDKEDYDARDRLQAQASRRGP